MLKFFNDKEKEIQRLKRELKKYELKREQDLTKMRQRFEREVDNLKKEQVFKICPREKYKNCVRKSQIHDKLRESVTTFNESSEFLKTYGLKIKQLILTEEEHFKQLNFDINKSSIKLLNKDSILYIKDKYKCSDELYKVLRKVLDVPSYNFVCKRRREINKMHPIHEFDRGFYIEPEFKVNQILNNLFAKKPDLFAESDQVKIKIQMDGFACYNEQSCLNFAFSIINEKKAATTASGTYTLGLFEIDFESYENISLIVKQIWEKIKGVRRISFKEKEFCIKYTMGGDLKMMALVRINSIF